VPPQLISVPVDGSTRSSEILTEGKNYRITVSGTFSDGSRLADAEYADFSNIPSSLQDICFGTGSPGIPNVDLGIGIDDTVNDDNKSPRWGNFNSNHVYTLDLVGQGMPLTFNYHDCDYFGNVGSLTITIETYQPIR
jgi:hypothetical protein